MENNFVKIMSQRTDIELIKILTERRNDYQAEAITAAEIELKNRNISNEKLEEAVKVVEANKVLDFEKANMELEDIWKFLTFAFPGIIQIMYSGILKTEGYEKKAKTLSRWTLYGICFYFGGVILIIILQELGL